MFFVCVSNYGHVPLRPSLGFRPSSLISNVGVSWISKQVIGDDTLEMFQVEKQFVKELTSSVAQSLWSNAGFKEWCQRFAHSSLSMINTQSNMKQYEMEMHSEWAWKLTIRTSSFYLLSNSGPSRRCYWLSNLISEANKLKTVLLNSST